MLRRRGLGAIPNTVDGAIVWLERTFNAIPDVDKTGFLAQYGSLRLRLQAMLDAGAAYSLQGELMQDLQQFSRDVLARTAAKAGTSTPGYLVTDLDLERHRDAAQNGNGSRTTTTPPDAGPSLSTPWYENPLVLLAGLGIVAAGAGAWWYSRR